MLENCLWIYLIHISKFNQIWKIVLDVILYALQGNSGMSYCKLSMLIKILRFGLACGFNVRCVSCKCLDVLFNGSSHRRTDNTWWPCDQSLVNLMWFKHRAKIAWNYFYVLANCRKQPFSQFHSWNEKQVALCIRRRAMWEMSVFCCLCHKRVFTRFRWCTSHILFMQACLSAEQRLVSALFSFSIIWIGSCTTLHFLLLCWQFFVSMFISLLGFIPFKTPKIDIDVTIINIPLFVITFILSGLEFHIDFLL